MDATETEELLQLCTRYLRETRLPQPLPATREEYERYVREIDRIEASEDAEDAWFHLDHLTFAAPPDAWSIIVELVARTENEDDLGTIGAGVLETFIHHHGDEWAEAIEKEMLASHRFTTAMRMVRGVEDHPELRRRLSEFPRE